jgi:processive 1,2-diacylglycerol beta-glucosyltransferase/1,2-diacylglycerol 3-beta-galactosyltransferase
LEKYLFLYLKTGGGHLAPAKAVADKIKSKNPASCEIDLVDGLSGSKKIIRTIIEDGYKTAINKAAWTYEFLYLIHKITLISRLTAAIAGYFMKPALEKYILQKHPEKIVLFHFFLIKPVFEIIESHNLGIPVVTVVTDPFTAHPIWFLRRNQNYIVFSELLKEKCIEIGIDEKMLKVFPYVIDSRFTPNVSDKKKSKIRANLGFASDSRIILIIGGGEGMPKGKKILKKIIRRNMDAEIAIVCGKNVKLYNGAIKIRNKYGLSNLKVYGLIEFVHSLISISDIVITKCGASTSMEILMMGKVPVINNYIWEQEKGNMEFVCNSNMGILERNTNSLPDVLNRLLVDNDLYKTLTDNIKKASLRNGVGQVSDYILNFR